MAMNMASTEMGYEDDMDSSREELLEASQAPRFRTMHRGTVAFVTVLFAMCAAISFWHYPGVIAKSKAAYFVGLDEEINITNCSGLPFARLEKVLSNNLALHGPDNDKEEGIIYEITEHNTGLQSPSLQIHIHSLSSFDVTELNNETYDKTYRPAFKSGEWVNGLHDRFGVINIHTNTSVKLRAQAYDASAKKYIPIPHGVMSFFDFDMGANAVEQVKITGFKRYFVTNDTVVNVTQEGNFYLFAATTRGSGEDNPADPRSLTRDQMNKAITVEFEDAERIDFEISTTHGCEGSECGRVFSFVFRPSLLCHKVGEEFIPTDGVTIVKNAAPKQLPSVFMLFACLAILTQHASALIPMW